MGGDSAPEYVGFLARHLHNVYPSVKVAWYSGRSHIPSFIEKSDFDYIKTGPYIEHLGGLKSKTTNQHLYMRVSGNDFVDITCRFWKP